MTPAPELAQAPPHSPAAASSQLGLIESPSPPKLQRSRTAADFSVLQSHMARISTHGRKSGSRVGPAVESPPEVLSPSNWATPSPAPSPAQQTEVAAPFNRADLRSPSNWATPSPAPSPLKPRAPVPTYRAPTAITGAVADGEVVAEADLEDVDPAALEAARWTNEQVAKLIGQIKQQGVMDSGGIHTIKFGVLFDTTANIFDALSGICKTAKK
jgi:hypothetical protein